MKIVGSKKKKNIGSKKILFGLLGLLAVLGSGVISYLLVSKLVSLIMYLLTVNMLGVMVACTVVSLGVVIVLLAKEAIKVETVYEDSECNEMNAKMMREQLYVIKREEQVEQKTAIHSANNYAYSFGNNCVDTEEEMIDDLDWLCLDDVTDNIFKGSYSRSKRKYNGKYSK